MKNIKKILFIAIILFIGIAGVAKADTNIHLTIKTNSGNIYDQDMAVAPCNNDNSATASLVITGYCAVMQTGFPSSWNWSWPPGAFLNSLNNIAGYTSQDSSGNDVYHYWSWAVNGTDGMTGLNEYVLIPGDLITLTFIDPVSSSPTATIFSGSTTTLIKEKKVKPIFDIQKAFEYLTSKQKNNGSFGEDLYTDWIAIALGSTQDSKDQKEKLVTYLTNEKIINYKLTDYERQSMALMSLGLDPYNTNGENYIKKITEGFDGKQFGNAFEDNDDIFALIVLQNAGFTKDENIINNTVNFILSKQKPDGSWDENVDMTGAAIESLSNYKDNSSIQIALEKGGLYLKKGQRDDGSFSGNVSSTAWAIEGILSLGEKPEDWEKNDNSPLDYLAENQDVDGGIREADTNSKIWETAYTLASLSGKPWNQIMQKFDKPKTETIETPKTETTMKPVIKKTAINKDTPTTTIVAPQPEPQKKSWFRRFLGIFGI